MGKFINLTDKKFGQLTVLSQAKYHNKRIQWKCKCSCGNYINICTKDLNNGKRICCKKCGKTNCLICGKRTKNKKICSNKCKIKFDKLSKNPLPPFYSYKHAAAYLQKDQRTIRKWENILYKIDKNLKSDFNLIKWKNCKICRDKTPSAKCRVGYCKKCSEKGLGRKNTAKILSKKYKGKGNPNYVHGKKMEHSRERSVMHDRWAKKNIKNKTKCMHVEWKNR
ncbi:MAG: hypothetical protein ACTSSP_10455 [Candidatus Asgardarchaeia archaeon]